MSATSEVLDMLAERQAMSPLLVPLPRRPEELKEPPIARIFSCWVTPHGRPTERLPVEAMDELEAHRLARKAAFLMFPGLPFTTVVRSK